MQTIYAYLLIYFGVLLEGELALLASSLAAQKGLLNIYLVALTAFISTLSTDWLIFFTGRVLGKSIFEKYSKLHNRTLKPRRWIRSNPQMILIFYRFLYGFRIITLLILGMSRVSVKRFMFMSFIAIFIWTLFFSLLGYYMGEIINNFISQYENLALYLATGIIFAAFVLILVRNIVRKAL